MTDKDLALNGSGGVVTLQMTTPNTNTAGITAPTSVAKLVVASDSGSVEAGGYTPVSGTFRFSRCKDEKVSN